MNSTKLTLSVLTAATLVTATLAFATPSPSKNYSIYVYQDCQQLEVIPMSNEQIDAYLALSAEEIKLDTLELPIDAMEQELDLYEQDLKSLSQQVVMETEGKIVVDKTLLRQQQEVADKIQRIVNSHKSDFKQIEMQADIIEQQADTFEQLIKPSIAKYDGEDISVVISEKSPDWQCHVGQF